LRDSRFEIRKDAPCETPEQTDSGNPIFRVAVTLEKAAGESIVAGMEI
jgi:hypothetical protein